MKILIVEDSGVMRTIERRAFLKMGVPEQKILEATDGLEALAIFNQELVNLIVCDWNMPQMDGLAFLKEVRKVDRHVPVIMATSEAERSRVLQAINSGVTDYLIKPFTPDELCEKLRRWIPVAH